MTTRFLVPGRLSSVRLFGAFLLLLVTAAAGPAAAQTGGVVGRWKTIDDETGRPKAIVELTEERGEVKGRIVDLVAPPVPNPICEACEGERRGKPIRGLVIVWGMRAEKGGKWGGGRILDPKSGKEYRCKMELVEGGTRLEVRGFVGFSLLGRTQVWQRVQPGG